MLDAVHHQHFLVKNCEKLPITALNGTHLARQTHRVGHVMPHPPPHIWACPHDQSQTTALLNPYLQDGTKYRF